MWTLKEENRREHAAEMKRRLEALVGVSEGLLTAEVGIGLTSAYQVVLTTTHASWEEYERYQGDTAHGEVKKFIAQVTTARACCDFEM